MDIAIRKFPSGSPLTYRWQTDAGDPAIVAGQPLKLKAAGGRYVVGLEDGDLTIGTDTAFVGIAKSDSTHTASADGEVEVYIPFEGTVYEIKAKSATAVDTQAEIDALRGKRCVIDLTTGVYTLDTAASDAAANAFVIIGGNAAHRTLYVIVRASATVLN